MNILRPAIEEKLLNSAIYNDVGGRCYYNVADSSDYPRLVFSRVTGNPDNVFAKKGESVLIQFDLLSMKSAGKTEIDTMEADLKTLFDDCDLTLTGYTLVGFSRRETISFDEQVEALADGTTMITHVVVDYQADYEAN
jgi:hypothetical protein